MSGTPKDITIKYKDKYDRVTPNTVSNPDEIVLMSKQDVEDLKEFRSSLNAENVIVYNSDLDPMVTIKTGERRIRISFTSLIDSIDNTFTKTLCVAKEIPS
ncbi:hypothetical protein [Winogradskyella thalassocola]|uniref:Uncharacterized protein n=1 Tax=Winogradskyella thalassocola TaxID=262004 RepID=A0A1G8FIX6_9FLAO|nr:hypothetical protein [Winogradskyella thalassocola]SDH82068.1 hypothetical protein SAMN04489796_104267 [Winogradskyella thalassocola]